MANLIYVVIAAILYAAIYYLFLGKQGTNTYSTNYSQPTTTTDETANWKTYTSKYGYSFEYPSNWKAESGNLDADDEIRIVFKDPKNIPTELQILLKNPRDLPKNMSFDDWIKTNFPSSPDIPQKEKEITIAENVKAKEISSSYEGVSKLVLIPYQSKVYSLQFNVVFGKMTTYEEAIYNQILSTFKFE